jgi:hypothetical protein
MLSEMEMPSDMAKYADKVSSSEDMASPSELGRMQCLLAIASLEGLLRINLPSPADANTSLKAIDARVRTLEIRKRVATPPPMQELTQETLAWRIGRVRLMILHDWSPVPLAVIPSVTSMCPREKKVTLRELRDLVASIPTSKVLVASKWTSSVTSSTWLPEISPTWTGDDVEDVGKKAEEDDITLAKSDANDEPSKSRAYELEMFNLIVQQLAHHVGARSNTFHIEKLDMESVYSTAMNMAINIEYWSNVTPIAGIPPANARRVNGVDILSLTPRGVAPPLPGASPPVIVNAPRPRKSKKQSAMLTFLNGSKKKSRGRGRRRDRSVSSFSSSSSDDSSISSLGSDMSDLPKRRYAPFRWVKGLFCRR